MRWRGAAVRVVPARGAKAMGVVRAHQEHREPFGIFAPFTHLFALVEYGDRHAVDRARQRGIDQPPHPEIDRGIPCMAERMGIGAAAKVIGRCRRQPDARGRLGHAGRCGERLDKLALAVGGPAAAALALKLRGGEGGQRGGQALRRRALQSRTTRPRGASMGFGLGHLAG